MNDDFRAQVHVVEDELARLSSRIEAFKAAFHEHPTRVEWNGTQWLPGDVPTVSSDFPKHTAAIRRASLDLTAALATLRRARL